MLPLTFWISVEWVFSGSSLDEGKRGRDRAGERGASSDAVFLEQRDELGREVRAVLDGVDARLKPHAHALGALDVGCGRHAELVRFVDRRRSDFGRHAQNARLAFLLRIEDASGDEQLHEVAFAREAVADDLARLLGGLSDVGEQPRAVAVWHRDADARSEQTRPLVLPCVDRVAHVYVGKARVAHRAHGGHATRELLLRMLFDDAPQVPHADRISHHLVDEVAPAPALVGLPEPQRCTCRFTRPGTR